MALLPPAASGSPFGPFAAVVASAVSVAIVAAALVDHLLIALGKTSTADPFLDSAALLVIGVVLGVGVIGGTASAALTSATAAHVRLDEIGAPTGTGKPDAVG